MGTFPCERRELARARRHPHRARQAHRRRGRRTGGRARWCGWRHTAAGRYRAQHVGSSRRQAPLRDLQLPPHDPAGTDAHAAMTRVVLGSASPGRSKVLRQAGIEPLVVVSGVDEDAVATSLPGGTSPADITTVLAVAKAEDVVKRLDPSIAADCVVIGCDSMLYCA